MGFGLHMHDEYDHGFEQANPDHALLAVSLSIIRKENHRRLEHTRRIGEIQPVLGDIRLSLGLIPAKLHGTNYTYIYAYISRLSPVACVLPHSAVTLLAKFLGLSASVPRVIAV